MESSVHLGIKRYLWADQGIKTNQRQD